MKSTVCRVCHANCSLLVEMSDGRVTKIIGDKDNPIYQGFSCIKGRELHTYHASPQRLLHSVARGNDGTFTPIPVDTAMDSIAARLDTLRSEHGPHCIAVYSGTHSYQNLTAVRLLRAFLDAIGSPMYFDTTTIDQPGKTIARTVHGVWSAGGYNCEEADAWLLVGTNPIASMQGGFSVNPAANLHTAKARGLQLIVVDPRRSDVARRAAIHLQPRPGHSAAILAALIRIVITEQRYNRAFVADHVAGFDELRESVAPFTVESVARAADISVDSLLAAARTYSGARRAGVNVGTGPNMSGHCSVVEYLALALMTICGHWRRAGEVRPNPGVLFNPLRAIAEAIPGRPATVDGVRMRVRGLAQTAGGLPTAALSDEILLAGERKIRALIVLGGNPLLAMPDQIKAHAALQSLDLLVCIDPLLGATARLAHYVIAPKLSLETITTSVGNEMLGAFGPGWGYLHPYAQWAGPVLDPPAGSELIEDWELFYGLAQRLGLKLRIAGAAHVPPRNQEHAFLLDMSRKPTTEQLYDRLLAGSPVPLDEVKSHPRGACYSRPQDITVPATAPAGTGPRLNVGEPTLMAELTSLAHETDTDTRFEYRLISRRLSSSHNSSWHDSPKLSRREPYNRAYMHPDDLRRMGIAAGGPVEITSARATIRGIAAPAEDVRPGTLSMSHCWGDWPGNDDDTLRWGSSVARLIFNDRDFDPLTGIPRMSNIPVNVRPFDDSGAARPTQHREPPWNE